MHKKVFSIFLLSCFVLLATTAVSSCKTKEGCGLEDKYKENLNSKKEENPTFGVKNNAEK